MNFYFSRLEYFILLNFYLVKRAHNSHGLATNRTPVWKKLKSCTYLASFLQNMVFLQASCKLLASRCQSCKNHARQCKSCKMINWNTSLTRQQMSYDNVVNSFTNCRKRIFCSCFRVFFLKNVRL